MIKISLFAVLLATPFFEVATNNRNQLKARVNKCCLRRNGKGSSFLEICVCKLYVDNNTILYLLVIHLSHI